MEGAESHIPKPDSRPARSGNSELEPALLALEVVWMHSWSSKLLVCIVILIAQNEKDFFFFVKLDLYGNLNLCTNH